MKREARRERSAMHAPEQREGTAGLMRSERERSVTKAFSCSGRGSPTTPWGRWGL